MLAEISIMQIGKGRSLSKYVAEVVKYIKDETEARGMGYELNSMGTLIEGNCDDVFEIAKQAHNLMKKYSERVVTTIKIDDNQGKKNQISYKKSRIEKLLERK